MEKIRIDKKNRTCKRCGYTCATPQKLREHLERKNPCRAQNFVPVQAPRAEPEIITDSTNIRSIDSLAHIEPFPVKNLNDRKPGETIKQWGSRLRKRYKAITYENYEQPKTLAECKRLYNDLSQIDSDAFSSTSEEQNANNSKQAEIAKLKLLNDEFQRLSNITEENGEDILFREQNLGPVLKRRAVAVHNAKVPRFNPNNG